MVINPVCKMNVEPEKAAAKTEYAQLIDAIKINFGEIKCVNFGQSWQR